MPKSDNKSETDMTPSEQEHAKTYVSNILDKSIVNRRTEIRVN